MTNIDPVLGIGIHGDLPLKLRRYILANVWNTKLHDSKFDNSDSRYDPYFKHYQTLCQNCSTDDVGRLTHEALIRAFEYMISATYDDCKRGLTSYLAKLKDPPRDTKAVAVADLLIQHTGQALLLLDLCEWTGSDTLQEHLQKNIFEPSSQDDNFRVPYSLNLKNLQNIVGLKIRWTNLLSEHLSLEKEDTQLAVFHHAAMLEAIEDNQLYPQGIMEEVRLTYGLLLPHDDAKSRNWFQKQVDDPSRRAAGSSKVLDPAFDLQKSLKPGQRNIRRLKYFRDRMICLKDLYDGHTPQTFMQQCRDSRQPARRWGFFIAILLFLFGTGQLIEGAIQCYKAYHPTK